MLRRALLAVAVLAVVAVLAAVGWYVWLPSYRPSLRAGESYGIDVSAHQGAIDWRRVARDRIGFAYVKATEGADHTDASFSDNVFAAHDAGLDVGAYHFFTLCSSGVDQAAHFLGTGLVATLTYGLPPAVDLELAGNCSRRPSRDEVAREVAAFADLVPGLVLYVGDDWRHAYGAPSGPRWVRRVLRRPHGDWSFWQVDGWARVDGVRGHVDLDVRHVR